ncbi:MAG: DNA methyltransferase [Cyanobacteria bacterium P01_F01_bin.150]
MVNRWRDILIEGVEIENPELLQNYSNIDSYLNSIIVRTLWLKLCEVQETIGQDSFLSMAQKEPDKDQLLPWLKRVNPITIKTVLQQVFSLNLKPLVVTENSSVGIATGIILGHVYEYLIGHPVSDKTQEQKRKGSYYTPLGVVNYIVEKTVQSQFGCLPTDEITVLDPACGAGIFLLVAYQRLLTWYRQQLGDRVLTFAEKKDILLRHIYGVDLDAQAVDVTRLGLLLILTEDTCCDRQMLIELTSLLDRNIQWGNALIEDDILQNSLLSEVQRDRIHPFNWQTAFPHIFPDGQAPSSIANVDNGFQIVIGNPPYIDAEAMSRYYPEERHYCTTRYTTASGNWDIFCVFCERALQLCRIGGLSSFIVPNKLAAADYAQQTRYLLAVVNRLVYLRDYSAIPVFAIAVYPLVYVVQKEADACKPLAAKELAGQKSAARQLATEQARVQWERMVSASSQTSHTGKNWQTTDASVTGEPTIEEPVIERRSLPYHYFCDAKRPWAIASTEPLQTLMLNIHHQGTPLGQIATVVGAATVSEAYDLKPLIQEICSLEKSKQEKNKQSSLEAETDIGYFKFINSGTIDPYCFLWGQKKLRYLKQRFQAPVITYSQKQWVPSRRWHQAQSAKIVVAGMTLRLECALDGEGEFFPGKSTTVIYQQKDTPYDLRYLLAILNSTLMSVYYRAEFGGNALNGGYLRIGPPQVKQLPIQLGTDKQQAGIVSLVDALVDVSQGEQKVTQSLRGKRREGEREAIARQIDQQVYALYNLSTEDIKLLESRSVSYWSLGNKPPR